MTISKRQLDFFIEIEVTVETRLVNGTTPHDGRVEVRTNNGPWNTICNENWDLLDAYVVCRMLNYSKAVSAGTARVKGRGPIYPKYLNCHGHETSIEECLQYPYSCDHSRDASVVCGNLTQGKPEIIITLK